MNILVTGATGYLGKALVPVLQEAGHHLRILARPSSDIRAFQNQERIEISYGDIVKPETLNDIAEGIDQVYHLAVLGHLNDAGQQDYMNVNHAGTLNLLEQFKNSPVQRILFTTSSAALGPIAGKVVTEEDFAPPVTAYGRSKYAAELSFKEYAQQHNIPYVLVRLTHVYGPGEQRDLYQIIKLIKKGLYPQIGFKPNLYPAVYIDDAVRGLVRAMEKGRVGETYIISDKSSHDTRDIRKWVRHYLGLKNMIYPWLPKCLALGLFTLCDYISHKTGLRFPATRKNIEFMTARRIFSIEKANTELDWEPQITLEEGLRRTIDAYRQEGLI